ncbi:serine hydrolase [Corynebacterium hansenii]|uniref:Serine hydrolase n=1 Tax=Corynebacterium hansenii TaxID=394964 RepID=A0ABV7ZJ50_9CORY|nr:serine hydrolase [Corynebacterium hansenii]WJY99587.1 hypothetical protein CHAN_04825 [Corynebacterium hansenii]
MRAGSTRKRPGLIAAALAVTAMLVGCAGTSPEEGPGTETRVAEPTDGWDPAEEVEWTDAQEILDDAVAEFSELYGIDLAAYVRVIDGPYRGLTASAGGDERQYSASTIKAPLVVTALDKFGDDLDEVVTADWEDAVGGSVIGPGEYTVESLLRYVMAYSDNTAANALIDAVGGFDAVNGIIEDAGVDGERYHLGNKMNTPNPTGDRSWFSPSQSALFMARIQEVADGHGDHAFIDRDTARTALTYLTYGGAQKFAMYVGGAAQKTGDTIEGTNDHGILYSGAGPVAFGITTRFETPMNELTDALLGRLGGRIAALLPDYNLLGAGGKAPSPKEAATWNADADGDGIADRLGGTEGPGDPLYDETLEPDWFNPHRAV